MDKPITMLINETKAKIVNDLNTSNLPAWVMEYILKDICEECARVSKSQAEKEKAEYLKETEN